LTILTASCALPLPRALGGLSQPKILVKTHDWLSGQTIIMALHY